MTVFAIWSATALLIGQMPDLPQADDPRIQVVAYNPAQVVTLPVAAGYAAVVELGPDERVDSLIVGASGSWQVTASRRGDHIIVKPLEGAQPTDLIVVTGERRYVFLLQPSDRGGAQPFVLRFAYPQAAPAEPARVPDALATFRFRGDRALFPAAMRDDGNRTVISWPPGAALPAIFAVDQQGREAIVNGRMVGDDFVVERVSERFSFRSGRARATALRRPAPRRR